MNSIELSVLSGVVTYLLAERTNKTSQPHSCKHISHVSDGDVSSLDQLQLLKHLLCVRSPSRGLPVAILNDIDTILQHQLAHYVLTPATSIVPLATTSPRSGKNPTNIQLTVWKGDITTLNGVSAIVNAANSGLLGCFQPSHTCIDNVIHAAAGPKLRQECYEIMQKQGFPEPVGSVKITKGYNLPANFILHTVGPQLLDGRNPTSDDQRDLANCYSSCLEAAETLPALADGRKIIAFCCIATGLFAFPPDLAAKVAVNTTRQWLDTHPETTITSVIFDVFTDRDLALYRELLGLPALPLTPPPVSPCINAESRSLTVAKEWLREAGSLIICAGAGLSAATGLDYTSHHLFATYFPAFLKYDLRCLYDVFGFQGWPSLQVKWGYYFTHLAMVKSWPPSKVYAHLHSLAATFGTQVHVRTSNADGLFVANGFGEEQLSTPQGSYKYFQCASNCRNDAVFLSEPFLRAAMPHIDPETQILNDTTKIPRCRYCDGELSLCVRSGPLFNELPFAAGEQRWQDYRGAFMPLRDPQSAPVVILELGVGFNTPGVLRWPDERLAAKKNGPFKLIRAGIGDAGKVGWELENQGVAIGIVGDVKHVLEALDGVRNTSENC
ncbi:putative phosphatase like proteins to the carbon terminal domain of histone macroH2A1 [Bisporella sp. PMI_857]|nr:putative phosphatase like proteins to the carbon terminal domain of histone macroH2A1 [Bisporella sp. PMI_857]